VYTYPRAVEDAPYGASRATEIGKNRSLTTTDAIEHTAIREL